MRRGMLQCKMRIRQVGDLEEYEVIIIGGGLLGCFAALALGERGIKTAVFERENDVSMGISRACTAVIYPGYDTRPGTLKTELCIRGCLQFPELCRRLGVRYSKCGSVMTCFGEKGMEVIEKKYRNGLESGVPGIELITGDSVRELEPNLNSRVYGGLYSENTGTVLPWELCIAAFECARSLGVQFKFNRNVTGIKRERGGYVVSYDGGGAFSPAVVNCAGLFADDVYEMVEAPNIRIFPRKGDYFVFDTKVSKLLNGVVFFEPEEKGKGFTLVPTVTGNILAGPSDDPGADKYDASTTEEGILFLRENLENIIPGLSVRNVIRAFSAVRPNPYYVLKDGETYTKSGRSISEFMIVEGESSPGFLSFVGIKTPGLTAAPLLGEFAADKMCRFLGHGGTEKKSLPRRSVVRPGDLTSDERQRLIERQGSYGRIVCRCRNITEGEIIDAVRRGALTLDGVKRRTDAGTGRCQGSFCTEKILEIVAQHTGRRPEDIEKDRPGSYILRYRDERM